MTPWSARCSARRGRCPSGCSTIPTYTTKPTYYTEALQDYLLNRSNFLGDEQERANLLYRGGLQIHTTFDPNLQALAEQARDVLPDNAHGFDAAMVTLDTTTGAIRAMVGGSGFQPRVARGQHGARSAPDRIEHQDLHPGRGATGRRQPNDLIDGTAPCTLPDPNDPEEAVRPVNDATSQAGSGRSSQHDVVVDQLRLRPPVADRRAAPRRRHHVPHGALGRTLQPGRTSRPPIEPFGRRWPPAPTRWRRIDMAAGMQTIANQGLHHDPYYVEYIDRPDGTRLYTHDDPGRPGARPRCGADRSVDI